MMAAHRGRLWVALAAMVGRGLLGLAAPFFIGRSVDVIAYGDGRGPLLRYVILLLVFAGFTAICQWWMRWLWIGWSRTTEFSMRDRTFAHLLRLPVSFFHRNRVGDLMSRLTSDMEAMRMGYGPGCMHCAHPIVMTIGAVTLMMSTSPMLTIVAMVPMILLFLTMTAILPGIHEKALRVQERQADLSTRAQESFSGARVVKAFARESHEEGRFQELSLSFLSDSMAHARRRGLFQCLIELFAGLGSLAIFLFAGHLVIQGSLTIGDYVAFTGYLGLLIWPMIALGWTLALFKRAEAAQQRIDTLRQASPERDEARMRTVPAIRGNLEIRDLTFTYPDTDRPAIQGVSVTVPPSSTLGIVGATASGKTTLATLLQRLEDPAPGTINLDGHDVLELPLAQLRHSLAVVAQEPFLFSDTIARNIQFGRTDADRRSVEEAAWTACLDQDLKAFPDGIETVVGERGVTLSGGQRQRVAIARAVLKDAPVLILDDALSAVDTETERIILSRLSSHLEARTAVIISHRLSAVQGSDQIIVLDAGRIVEAGDHETLVSQRGTYARLWRLQQEEQDLEKS